MRLGPVEYARSTVAVRAWARGLISFAEVEELLDLERMVGLAHRKARGF